MPGLLHRKTPFYPYTGCALCGAKCFVRRWRVGAYGNAGWVAGWVLFGENSQRASDVNPCGASRGAVGRRDLAPRPAKAMAQNPGRGGSRGHSRGLQQAEHRRGQASVVNYVTHLRIPFQPFRFAPPPRVRRGLFTTTGLGCCWLATMPAIVAAAAAPAVQSSQ